MIVADLLSVPEPGADQELRTMKPISGRYFSVDPWDLVLLGCAPMNNPVKVFMVLSVVVGD